MAQWGLLHINPVNVRKIVELFRSGLIAEVLVEFLKLNGDLGVSDCRNVLVQNHFCF